MKLKTLLCTLPLALSTAVSTTVSTAVSAQTLDVTITNLTHGLHFTPLYVNAHGSDDHLFEVGQSASAAIQAMAEGGAITDLSTGKPTGSEEVLNPAEGLLAPTAVATITDFDTMDNTHLSLVAMILPTNDGFVGLDGWEIPQEAGTYTVYLNAYDAGTEVNDEIINGAGTPGQAGIPAAPNGDGGTGATGVTGGLTADSNTNIHIHRGNVGDTNATGGISDVDSRIHRWLNPVAKVVETVK